MQIVTDSGTDYRLAVENDRDLNIHEVPLLVTIGERTFQDGSQQTRTDFYRLLAETNDLPTTSQPSAGEFAALYKELAANDPDILSIHMSSGLSGTLNSAIAGAKMTPEANVTVIDTKTLSIGSGWQVVAAARAIRAGWPKEKILAAIKKIGDATNILFTLNELKYLIHGGRISHMKGLVASLLQIKPIIGVDHSTGKYTQAGQVRSFGGALQRVAEMVQKAAAGARMRVQIVHTANPEGAQTLQGLVEKLCDIHWLPIGPISFVLGAHTGASMIGVCFAPLSTFEGLP